MSRSFDLDPVDRITAGAVGEPGDRTFFVQAVGESDRVTLLAEKDQVRLLAEGIERLLAQIPDGPEGEEPADEDLELSPPLEPEWRVGEMAIEFDEVNDRVTIVFNELQPEETAEPPSQARFVASRAQVRAMADHALEIVAAGRPRCQFCGHPLEAEGSHRCPAMNGHGAPQV